MRNSILRTGGLAACAALVLVVVGAGCARVQPIQRELLSDPMMQLDSDPREQAHEQHWIETLEASTGGYGGAAGGCACY
jgi:hypothetical protein